MKTILVADDEPDLRDLVKRLLEEAGYFVILATDGEQAVAMSRSYRVDLAILDFSMPEKSGLEAAAIIRTTPETRHIPIVLMTAMELPPGEEAALRVFDGYFPKPFDTEKLLAHVRAIMPITVLIVHKEPAILGMMRRVLAPHFDVATATTADEGGRIAVLEKPDLVITELNLPGGDGQKLAANVIEYLNIPAIVITGGLPSETQEAAMQEIGITLVSGAIETSKFLLTVRSILIGRRTTSV